LFDGVPEGSNLDRIEDSLLALPGVLAVRDLHVWAMSTEENALTAHLVCEQLTDIPSALLRQATGVINTQFGIEHVTLQCEPASFAEQCAVFPECLPGTGSQYRGGLSSPR